MNDPFLVRGFERVGDLARDVKGFRNRDRRVLRPRATFVQT
jgi:hypothetical protein